MGGYGHGAFGQLPDLPGYVTEEGCESRIGDAKQKSAIGYVLGVMVGGLVGYMYAKGKL